ncbi:MAG: sulfate adenylyltransferase subunit CysN [Proteobacteria bacterium]|nr:sulfate adenylyltransferase subunit CysN [Pseudomonadota bacterium]
MEPQTLLRLVLCGSVDDGKSTLLGRLLHDTGSIPEDQLAALVRDSRRFGSQGEATDLALLTDGLQAEREQGITIDVAYRFFGTRQRRFIVADAPGHEQYTRNMVTGASTADAAVVLVDATRGVLTQTRRHSFLVSLLGVRHLILAVNKMDAVGWSRAAFDAIAAEFDELARRLAIPEHTAIPLSALTGGNVVHRSEEAPWNAGPTLLELLESLPVDEQRAARLAFRMPVQWVSRPDPGFRGYAGLVVSGGVAPGDRVRVSPSGRESRIARIVTMDGDQAQASAGQSVVLTLSDHIDVSRGDMLSAVSAAPDVADQFECALVWMGDEPMLPGRSYLLKIGARTVGAVVSDLKHAVDVHSFDPVPAKTLGLNEVGVCNLTTDEPIAFDPYGQNRDTGGFILIDRITDATVAAGMLRFALRRAHNIRWQPVDIDKAARADLKGQKAAVLWFTGLSGSGKSTLANAVERRLFALGRHTYLLDGDNLRHGLNKDLGFTEADRVENIRRAAEVARLMVDAGLVVLAAFISPFRAERRAARQRFAPGEFMEVFVDAPLALAEDRDPKGLYKKARAGSLRNFTGVDSPYETPEAPELRVDTEASSVAEAVDQILERMRDLRLL